MKDNLLYSKRFGFRLSIVRDFLLLFFYFWVGAMTPYSGLYTRKSNALISKKVRARKDL